MSYIKINNDNLISEIIIDRPEALNAMNSDVLSELTNAMKKVKSDDKTGVVIITGAGDKAFIAGADVKFFVEKLKENKFEEIYKFTEAGHELLNTIEKSTKTTIALTTGITYGGGLEFALSCDYRIGSQKTDFRFPETGIGIYPGLGGTQRMARMVGVEIARWAILAGNRIGGEFSHQLGIIDELSSETEIEQTILKLAGISNKKPDIMQAGQGMDIATTQQQPKI